MFDSSIIIFFLSLIHFCLLMFSLRLWLQRKKITGTY